MAFIPATPGIVGFGGGNKPAVFQAVAPQYSLMNQQTDDDETPLCAVTDLQSVNAGITICGCIAITGVGNFIVTGTTGITGLQTITYSGGFWQSVIGTVTVQRYLEDDCTTPVGDPFDQDVIETIVCSAGIYDVTISFIAPKNSFSGSGPLGVTIVNGLSCADSGFIVHQVTLST